MNESEKKEIIRTIEKRNLSPKELERIIKAFENKPPKARAGFEDYFSEHTVIGVFGDTHIGHIMFDEPLFNHMVKIFNQRKVSRVYSVGDILEGMSERKGHIYELSELGFEKQIEKATNLFKRIPSDVYGINGNHDEWYQKNSNGGINVSIELEKRTSNYHHVGDMEADIDIGHDLKIKLFHANDGTAYAISYKMQKLMESFTGGEKPDVLLSGHYHKALYMFNRNIHGIECGTICGQTPWMRGKKIPAHKGFWVLEMRLGKGGIGMMGPTFYPGYK